MPGSLPYRAALIDYQREADQLWNGLQTGDDAAQWRVKWEHPAFRGKTVTDVKAASLSQADARLVIAQEYAFGQWPDLERFVADVRQEGPTATFEAAVEAVIDGNLATLEQMLARDPGLVRARSARRHHATLLHYLGANGVEGGRQRTPPNAVQVMKLLLDRGAEADATADLYDAKCTTMSMVVSSVHPAAAGLQALLAETLLDYGAGLVGPGSNWQEAVNTALTFGYLETARVLAKRGPPTEELDIAAGLGSAADVARLLPGASAEKRHAALALAAQLGHVEVVRQLLDAGEDPNRFNPDGHHAHSTPLHQAALGESLELVKLLVDRGARLDLRDKIYDGTPLGWANHAGRVEIAQFLKSRGA